MPLPPKTFSAGGILFLTLSVCECVCESVHPTNLVNTMSGKPMKGISCSFGHRWVRRCAH